MITRKLEISLPADFWRRLDALVAADSTTTDLGDLVTRLLDHVQQGVYRPGAWERNWLATCVGADVIEAAYERLNEPNIPSGRSR